MGTLYLIRGLPGCGKTTFAKTLEQQGVKIFAADDFFYNEHGDYNWDKDKIHLAHKHCQDNAMMAMKSGYDIAVHNTLTTEKELLPYIAMAEGFGYQVISLIVENRHGNENVHGVPDETIKKMKDRFSVKLV